jgi:hypothetical protein
VERNCPIALFLNQDAAASISFFVSSKQEGNKRRLSECDPLSAMGNFSAKYLHKSFLGSKLTELLMGRPSGDRAILSIRKPAQDALRR